MLSVSKDPPTRTRLVHSTQGSGSVGSVTATESKPGKTALAMKVTGRTIGRMVRVNSLISMAISTRATGSTIRLMDKESISM